MESPCSMDFHGVVNNPDVCVPIWEDAKHVTSEGEGTCHYGRKNLNFEYRVSVAKKIVKGSDCSEMLHMPRQQCCRSMCNISLRLW